MKIDLIGCNGFIGKSIQRVNRDNELRLWSHLNDKNINKFDLYDKNSWKKLLKSNPENIILLSWPGLPNYMEMFHLDKNLPAYLDLIKELVNVGLKNLVITGTCYEYGLRNGCLNEETPSDPLNMYAIAKDSLRRSLSIFCTENNIRFCWARVFYPYGNGQNPNSLLPALENAIITNKKSFNLSSGRQIRDYIEINQVAKIILNLANNFQVSGIFNCGSGTPISIRELVINKKNSMKSDIQLNFNHIEERNYEPLAAWADMKKYNCLFV